MRRFRYQVQRINAKDAHRATSNLSPTQRKQFAGPLYSFSLQRVPREKLESMTQSITIPHQGPQFQRRPAAGNGKFQGRHLSRLQLPGESYSNSILSKLD